MNIHVSASTLEKSINNIFLIHVLIIYNDICSYLHPPLCADINHQIIQENVSRSQDGTYRCYRIQCREDPRVARSITEVVVTAITHHTARV